MKALTLARLARKQKPESVASSFEPDHPAAGWLTRRGIAPHVARLLASLAFGRAA
jgi:hypothetical protein